MSTQDVIGERGESIFRVLMTRRHPNLGFLFHHPCFLGDKKRTIDFYIELIHNDSLVPFFFVQVKSTGEGYTQKENRLKVQITAPALQRLAAYPAPTYIIGIDEIEERGYILSANGESNIRLGSLCTHYPLNPQTLALLWEEVRSYWATPNPSAFQSIFRDPRWGQQ